MKTYPFSALFSRMKYITRWCLMRSTRPESLSEHTADTAMLAHTLCLIGRHCTGTGAPLRPEVVATAAIYHDAPEILTGDMPTPVKYKNDALRTAYKAVEHESARVMASLQPEELQAETQVWLTGSVLNDAERKILKAADRLSAVIKCIEEDRGGNREFEAAYAQQMAALHAMHSPEAEYFIEHMLPCYEQNLDELTRDFNTVVGAGHVRPAAYRLLRFYGKVAGRACPAMAWLRACGMAAHSPFSSHIS